MTMSSLFLNDGNSIKFLLQQNVQKLSLQKHLHEVYTVNELNNLNVIIKKVWCNDFSW